MRAPKSNACEAVFERPTRDECRSPQATNSIAGGDATGSRHHKSMRPCKGRIISAHLIRPLRVDETLHYFPSVGVAHGYSISRLRREKVPSRTGRIVLHACGVKTRSEIERFP